MGQGGDTSYSLTIYRTITNEMRNSEHLSSNNNVTWHTDTAYHQIPDHHFLFVLLNYPKFLALNEQITVGFQSTHM